MDNGHWLRPQEVLPDMEQIDSFYVKGSQWQLYTTVSGGYALAVASELYEKWLKKHLLEEGLLLPAGQQRYVFTVPEGELISSVEFGPYVKDLLQVKAFARALKNSMPPGAASLADGIYISRIGRVLPTFCDRDKGDPALILGSWICAGMQISLADTGRIHKYASFLPDDVRLSLLAMFHIQEQEQAEGEGTALRMPSAIDSPWNRDPADGYGAQHAGRGAEGTVPARGERKAGLFLLPGRPALEKFFREEIIDVIDHEEEYRRFGTPFPGATLLFGPSGSGKTFAVEKLAEYLGWPVLRINSGSVGSKWVHETSRKVSEMFDRAIRQAPSILIIDEMEAFLSSRESARGSYEIHMEEVGEFLRRIPDAAANHVLLFGMTNMPDAIDKAILRKGRFDHVIEVGMPSAAEVKAVLEGVLKDLPVQGNLSLERLADQLAGHPLSDVTFVISEAGRISVRRRQAGIDASALQEALRQLKPWAKPKRQIGFTTKGV